MLNPGRSNAVLFPTAFGWRSVGLAIRNSLADFVPSKSNYRCYWSTPKYVPSPSNNCHQSLEERRCSAD